MNKRRIVHGFIIFGAVESLAERRIVWIARVDAPQESEYVYDLRRRQPVDRLQNRKGIALVLHLPYLSRQQDRCEHDRRKGNDQRAKGLE